MDYSKLSFILRLMMKAMKSPNGDFRDWEAIRDWASQVRARLVLRSTIVPKRIVQNVTSLPRDARLGLQAIAGLVAVFLAAWAVAMALGVGVTQVMNWLDAGPNVRVFVGDTLARGGNLVSQLLLARLDPSRPVFVVEGIVDYVTLWQWGYQAVATLGTSIKAQDARRLARAAQVVFVPDGDEAGQAAAARWQEVVGHGYVLRLPEGVDDVNDLAQQADGEEIFHRLVEVLES